MADHGQPAGVVVYTVLFNDYDHLPRVPRGNRRVRYVCITDREPVAASGWEVKIVDPPPLHPYAQRMWKIMSHEVFPDADVTLYLDSNLELCTDPLALVERYLSGSDLALFRHPQRDSIYDEIEACARLGKDHRDQLALVSRRYREMGLPDRGLLHACGLLLRRHTEAILHLNAVWLEELQRSSIRDQPALGYALWKTGVRPTAIDADIWDNDIVSWAPHSQRLPGRDREYLFIGGNPRSGTTALASLLNIDPRIVVGMERYRKVSNKLSPAHFLEPRFFEPKIEETSFMPVRLIPQGSVGLSVWPEDEDAVRKKWASSALRYVGDKAPFYVRRLGYLRRVFPGSRLVILLRGPVGVAASYQRRADDPGDHWPSENGWQLGVEHWNQSVADLLSHIESHGIHDVFIIDYERFYSGDIDYLQSLYRYLGMTPSPEVVARYAEITPYGGPQRRTSPRLDAAAEREVRDLADWTGYEAIRALVPLMRSYTALDASHTALAALRHRADLYADQYRSLFDLARRLVHEAGTPVDHDDAEAGPNRAEELWRSYWGSVGSMLGDREG